MRQQLRLRVLLPVAVLGLLGAGFGAYAMGQPASPASTALPPTTSGATDTAPTTTESEPTPPPTKPKPPAKKRSPLARELADHRAVVVVFHTPDADLDRASVREARAGAAAVGAGFLAVDVTREGAVASLATRFEVLEAPTVLVVVRGLEARARFDGYVDRETVAQAVTNVLK